MTQEQLLERAAAQQLTLLHYWEHVADPRMKAMIGKSADEAMAQSMVHLKATLEAIVHGRGSTDEGKATLRRALERQAGLEPTMQARLAELPRVASKKSSTSMVGRHTPRVATRACLLESGWTAR